MTLVLLLLIVELKKKKTCTLKTFENPHYECCISRYLNINCFHLLHLHIHFSSEEKLDNLCILVK